MAIGLVFARFATAATLEVSVPNVSMSEATTGTEFDVPIAVHIPNGNTGQGLARLYVRILSAGSTNVIAPVPGGTLVFTSWGVPVLNFGARIRSFLRDLDGDGDPDAGDTGLADLGNVLNNSIGIGGKVVVLTQRWKFVSAPTPGISYALAVQFPATKSRHCDGLGLAVPFAAQTAINGSVSLAAMTTDLSALVAAIDTMPGDGQWNTQVDIDHDGEITSTDLAVLLMQLQTE